MNSEGRSIQPNTRDESPEQRLKQNKGQKIEPQAERWNTQQPPERDKKSPNTNG